MVLSSSERDIKCITTRQSPSDPKIEDFADRDGGVEEPDEGMEEEEAEPETGAEQQKFGSTIRRICVIHEWELYQVELR